jgi:hypothetical protein
MSIHARSYLTLLALSSLAATAACGGGGGSDPDQLVARWTEVPTSLNPDELDTLVFTDDGHFTLTEADGDITAGDWEADSTELTISGVEDGQAHTLHTLYAIEGDKFLMGALLPDGDVDGPVGVWRGNAGYDEREATFELTFNADATGRYVVDRSDGEADDVAGTWVIEGEELVFTYEELLEETEVTINLHFQMLPGVAIGGPMYQK